MYPLRLPLAALALIALFLPACGGGGSSGGGSSTSGFANFDLLLTDAPADDLLTLSVTVNNLRLVHQGGVETPNLLMAPVTVDLLSLQDNFAWLASKELMADTYTGVHLVLDPGSVLARKNDGSEVAVSIVSNDLLLDFTTPLVVTTTGYKRAVLDIDLANSLTGSVAAPPLLFDPLATLADDSSSSPRPIDEIKGSLAEFDAPANTFVMDATVDDDETVKLGQVKVIVPSTALLVRDDGGIFASRSAFFAALTPLQTRLEVHGTLARGVVTATRVEIEDNLAGGGEDNLVKLEGMLLGIGPGQSLEISIARVERGLATVVAALGGALPATLDVAWNDSTVFFLEEHQVTTSASLAVGQRVKIKFAMFDNAPFTASRIEIENEDAENEGHITAIGAGSTITLHLDDDSPAILGGQVQSTGTDVVVDLAGATIVLDTEGHPALTRANLQVGMQVEVEGSLGGTPAAPTIDASRLKVEAGELEDASVTSVTPAQSRFTTSGGEIEDPFGEGVGAGPLTVILAANCTFEGQATTRSAFFNLFSGTPPNPSLQVRVKGIGIGLPNEVRAYEIRVRSEDD